MILMSMINSIFGNLGTGAESTASPQPMAGSTEFASLLEGALTLPGAVPPQEVTGAPPGETPPPVPIDGTREDEQKTEEPNAQSKQPDIPSLTNQQPLMALLTVSAPTSANEVAEHAAKLPIPADAFSATARVIEGAGPSAASSLAAKAFEGPRPHLILDEAALDKLALSARADMPMSLDPLSNSFDFLAPELADQFDFEVSPEFQPGAPKGRGFRLDPQLMQAAGVQKISLSDAVLPTPTPVPTDVREIESMAVRNFTTNPAVAQAQQVTPSGGFAEAAVVEDVQPAPDVESGSASPTEFEPSKDVLLQKRRIVGDAEGATVSSKVALAVDSDQEEFSSNVAEALIAGEGALSTAEIQPEHAPSSTAAVAPNRAEAARTTEGEPLSREEAHKVIRELSDRIQMLAAGKPRGGVTIHLDPEHLGQVTLLVKTLHGQVEASIYAENESVRTAVQASHAQLQHQLEAKGLTLNNLSVSSSATELRQDQPQQGNGQQHQQPQSDRSQTTSFGEAPRFTLDEVRRMTQKSSGIDVWI